MRAQSAKLQGSFYVHCIDWYAMPCYAPSLGQSHVLDQHDVELLYRITPQPEISAFEPAGRQGYRLKAKNRSNASNLDVELNVRNLTCRSL